MCASTRRREPADGSAWSWALILTCGDPEGSSWASGRGRPPVPVLHAVPGLAERLCGQGHLNSQTKTFHAAGPCSSGCGLVGDSGSFPVARGATALRRTGPGMAVQLRPAWKGRGPRAGSPGARQSGRHKRELCLRGSRGKAESPGWRGKREVPGGQAIGTHWMWPRWQQVQWQEDETRRRC